MLKGLDNNEKIEYVSKQDSGDNPTVFLIGNISNRDKLRLFSDAVDPMTGAVNLAKIQEKAFDILQKGLKGIRNFDGKDITEVTQDVVDKLDFTVAIEVVGKIVEFNFQSDEEVKNS